MTIKEKLAAIYKEIANKEKTMGCKYLVYAKNRPNEIMEAIEEGKNFTLYFGDDDYAVSPSEEDYYECYNIKEIIGHPVMIGDVMDYLEDKSRSQFDYEEDEEYFYSREEYYEDIAELSDCWVNKRLPIDNQSDECIDFIYSLIKK